MQPGLLLNQRLKSLRVNSFQLIKFCYTRKRSFYRDKVNRVASRRSVVMVFATPYGQFYPDVTTPYRLSGLSHLDNFIVTRKSCPLTGTLQKHMPTRTRPATQLNRRAVSLHGPQNLYRDNCKLGFC